MLMKKSLIFVFLAVWSALATAGEPATVDMTLKQVSEHVYFAEGVPGVATDNQGFITTPAPVTITPALEIKPSLSVGTPGTPST